MQMAAPSLAMVQLSSFETTVRCYPSQNFLSLSLSRFPACLTDCNRIIINFSDTASLHSAVELLKSPHQVNISFSFSNFLDGQMGCIQNSQFMTLFFYRFNFFFSIHFKGSCIARTLVIFLILYFRRSQKMPNFLSFPLTIKQAALSILNV